MHVLNMLCMLDVSILFWVHEGSIGVAMVFVLDVVDFAGLGRDHLWDWLGEGTDITGLEGCGARIVELDPILLGEWVRRVRWEVVINGSVFRTDVYTLGVVDSVLGGLLFVDGGVRLSAMHGRANEVVVGVRRVVNSLGGVGGERWGRHGVLVLGLRVLLECVGRTGAWIRDRRIPGVLQGHWVGLGGARQGRRQRGALGEGLQRRGWILLSLHNFQ